MPMHPSLTNKQMFLCTKIRIKTQGPTFKITHIDAYTYIYSVLFFILFFLSPVESDWLIRDMSLGTSAVTRFSEQRVYNHLSS